MNRANPVRHSPQGAAATELILEVFRLNGRLLAAGDRLTRDIGLTSARWQVLGAIALAETALPVAQIARNMGLARQSVHRVVEELVSEGLLEFTDNPNHRRSSLVSLTAKGRAAYAKADERQTPWANGLARGLDPKRIGAAIELLQELRTRLEAAERE